MLDRNEAAIALGIATATLDKWRSQKRGPSYIKMGSAVRYQEHTVHEFQGRRVNPDLDQFIVDAAWTLFSQCHPADCIIYFIRTEGWEFLKIGIARKGVRERMRILQTSCPFKLIKVATTRANSADERKFHALFRDHHQHGEWFKITETVRAFIEKIEGTHR